MKLGDQTLDSAVKSENLDLGLSIIRRGFYMVQRTQIKTGR